MTFTALHRLLGRPPGVLTDQMVDQAVAEGLLETDDLDWKSEIPPAKGLSQTDFPKDIAAMANSGGGVIVYGIQEQNKAAVGRQDVGDVDERHESALRSVAVTAISPPVFGLTILRLGETGKRALAVVVPPSVDGPHLIYRNEYFGAPLRNDADTVWMKERQIEAMYRARFNERRHATEALDQLYAEAASGRDSDVRAWMIAVAHPRLARLPGARPTREEARECFAVASRHALAFAGRAGIHPLETVDRLNPRPGLRRWTAPNTATAEFSRWKEAWASVHHDGSVTLSAAVGGFRHQDGFLPGWRIEAQAIECVVADLMGLLKAVGDQTSVGEFEVVIGIEWTGDDPLVIQTVDQSGFPFDGVSTPLAAYSRITATVLSDAEPNAFNRQVFEIAQDCVNQGGISNLTLISAPSPDDDNDPRA